MKDTQSSLKGEKGNKVKDMYQIGTREQEPDSVLSQSGVELQGKQVSKVTLPDDTYRIHRIMQAVVRMDSHLKTPFSMFIGGYNYVEISEKLNIPVETVKKRIGSAREELQKILSLGDWQRN